MRGKVRKVAVRQKVNCFGEEAVTVDRFQVASRDMQPWVLLREEC